MECLRLDGQRRQLGQDQRDARHLHAAADLHRADARSRSATTRPRPSVHIIANGFIPGSGVDVGYSELGGPYSAARHADGRLGRRDRLRATGIRRPSWAAYTLQFSLLCRIAQAVDHHGDRDCDRARALLDGRDSTRARRSSLAGAALLRVRSLASSALRRRSRSTTPSCCAESRASGSFGCPRAGRPRSPPGTGGSSPRRGVRRRCRGRRPPARRSRKCSDQAATSPLLACETSTHR